jgi:ribosomal protein S18 acetylase RimI-like enzyme
MADPLTITICPQDRWAEALRLLAGNPSELCPDQVAVALRGCRMVGACAMIAHRDATGWIWPPVVVGYGHDSVAAALLRHGMQTLAQRGSKIVQCQVDPREPFHGLAESVGLRRLTTVLTLSVRCDAFGARETPTPVQFDTLNSGNLAQFKKLIARSYEGSLDCPELDQLRSAREAISGYLVDSRFDPALWLLARDAQGPIGCVVCTWDGEQRLGELQYLGIVPGRRRSGFGRVLCVRALAQLRARGARSADVTVDAHNTPALKLYEAIGFRERQRRDAYLASIKSQDDSDL